MKECERVSYRRMLKIDVLPSGMDLAWGQRGQSTPLASTCLLYF